MRACFGGFTGFHFEAPARGQGAALRALVWLWVKCGACFCSLSGVFWKQLGFMFRGGWGVLAHTDVAACADVQDALVALNAYLPLAQTLFLEKTMALKTLKQKALFSACLDDASWAAHLGFASAPAKAALLSEASAGGRTGLSWNYSFGQDAHGKNYIPRRVATAAWGGRCSD